MKNKSMKELLFLSTRIFSSRSNQSASLPVSLYFWQISPTSKHFWHVVR